MTARITALPALLQMARKQHDCLDAERVWDEQLQGVCEIADRYLNALKAEAINAADLIDADTGESVLRSPVTVGGITFRVTRAADGTVQAEEVVDA